MSGIGRYCTPHTWLTLLYTDSQDAIYLQALSQPGMGLLLPSFKGKTRPWRRLISRVTLLDVCVWLGLLTKTPFVFGFLRKQRGVERQGWGVVGSVSSHKLQVVVWPASTRSNTVVRSKTVSCLALQLDISCPRSHPTSFFPWHVPIL